MKTARTETQGTSSGLDGINAMDRLSDGTIIIAGTYCDMTKGDACNMTLRTEPSTNPLMSTKTRCLSRDIDGRVDVGNKFQPVPTFLIDLMIGPNDEVHLALLHRISDGRRRPRSGSFPKTPSRFW